MTGGAGINTVSSAQSKHAGGGKTARLGLSWGKLGCLGGTRGVDGEWGALAVVNGVINDLLEV